MWSKFKMLLVSFLNKLFKKKNDLEVDHTEIINGVAVIVGKFTYGTQWMSILSWTPEAGNVKIGRFCSISYGLKLFLGGNHHYSWTSTFPFGHIYPSNLHCKPIKDHPIAPKGISIGNDVWIGRDVTIMDGVHIPDGVIIAANSHVVKSPKPYSIVGGNPASHIKYRFDEKTVEQLLNLKWWDWENEKIFNRVELLCDEPNLERLLEFHH
jgi:acetyltransferase-like isoleucine patch superfamily enzyme